jgi:hypothetical protein
VLILVPAGFLVLILLGALAADSAVAYQARNQLHDALSAAANDAVAAGLNDRAFYSAGTLSLDPGEVSTVVCQSVLSQGLGSLHGLQLAVARSGPSVEVTGRASVDGVFGRGIPGFGTRTVSSSAAATLSGGAPARPPEFGPPTPVACG